MDKTDANQESIRLHEPLTIPSMSTERLMKLAEEDDGECVSVGGLAVKLGMYVQPRSSGEQCFYDRSGHPITLLEWGTLKEDAQACKVAQDDVGTTRVTSVWLGDAFEDEMLSVRPLKPRIYGTAIYPIPETAKRGTISIGAEIRSHSEEQARERHNLLVQGLRDGKVEEALATMQEDRVN
jgi:hypothetical protein